MVSRQGFLMAVALMVGAIGGCNVFWEGASSSYQITQPDAQDEGDTSSDDGAIREDGPDVRTGDATPPVDRVFAEVEDVSLEDVLTPQDTVMTDAVQDEGLVPVDLPAPEDVADVTDAGGALDTGVDVPASQDVLMPMDTSSEDVQMVADVVAPPDVGQDATSVATDGGDAGSPDAGIDTGPICPSGQTLCGGTCVSTTASADHCGACGMSCPAPVFPNMVRACQSGQCGAVCTAGFANCDGLMGNGCEVDTRVTPQHCGACGRSCSLANATPTCLGGSCYITSCATSFANCDNNEANGCEADTRSNVQHCGGCGRACAPMMHGTVSCVNGQCSVTCNEGSLLEGGLCVAKDLIVEYRERSLEGNISIPQNASGNLSTEYGILFGFDSGGFQSIRCDTAPVRFERNGVSWWRCIAARLTQIQVGSSVLVVGAYSTCGPGAVPSDCPARWREQWRVILRGRVYGHPTDTNRYTAYNLCPQAGWMPSGCVHLQLTP